MKRVLLVVVVALVAPAAALAKGASEATIDGPGLDTPIVIEGDGETPFHPLGRLAALTGFFPAVFERTPNPMLADQPGTHLGPRYAVSWVMPYGEQSSVIRQDVYPYATPYPVSYMEPGQPFFEEMRTLGGWYQGTPELKRRLVEVGLPANAPSTGAGGGMSGWQIGLLVLAGALALALLVPKIAVWASNRSTFSIRRPSE
jgi:hypothetical protein